jgi:hypothetical protein
MKDEQIARHAAAQRETERPGITDGEIKINGRPYSFQSTDLFEGGLHVLLPESFTDLPEEKAAIKYPSADRPKIILSDERGAATFTFNMIDSPLNAESTPRLARETRMLLQKLNPSYLFFDKEEKVESESQEDERKAEEIEAVISSIEYKSPAIDDAVYNVMFFAPIEGNTMMGTFSCPYEEYEEWKPVVQEILERIEIQEEAKI